MRLKHRWCTEWGWSMHPPLYCRPCALFRPAKHPAERLLVSNNAKQMRTPWTPWKDKAQGRKTCNRRHPMVDTTHGFPRRAFHPRCPNNQHHTLATWDCKQANMPLVVHCRQGRAGGPLRNPQLLVAPSLPVLSATPPLAKVTDKQGPSSHACDAYTHHTGDGAAASETAEARHTCLCTRVPSSSWDTW
jgi:hypothetical protein